MAIVESLPFELGTAGEVGCFLVPAPKPWIFLFRSLRFLAAILLPFDPGSALSDISVTA